MPTLGAIIKNEKRIQVRFLFGYPSIRPTFGKIPMPLAPFGPLGPLALAAPKGEVLNIQNGARTNHSFGIAFGA